MQRKCWTSWRTPSQRDTSSVADTDSSTSTLASCRVSKPSCTTRTMHYSYSGDMARDKDRSGCRPQGSSMRPGVQCSTAYTKHCVRHCSTVQLRHMHSATQHMAHGYMVHLRLNMTSSAHHASLSCFPATDVLMPDSCALPHVTPHTFVSPPHLPPHTSPPPHVLGGSGWRSMLQPVWIA